MYCRAAQELLRYAVRHIDCVLRCMLVCIWCLKQSHILPQYHRKRVDVRWCGEHPRPCMTWQSYIPLSWRHGRNACAPVSFSCVSSLSFSVLTPQSVRVPACARADPARTQVLGTRRRLGSRARGAGPYAHTSRLLRLDTGPRLAIFGQTWCWGLAYNSSQTCSRELGNV